MIDVVITSFDRSKVITKSPDDMPKTMKRLQKYVSKNSNLESEPTFI